MDQAIAIRDGRTRLKMSQEILAKAAEVSQRTVMRAEGGRSITFENLRAICSVLGLDASLLASPSPAVPGLPPEQSDHSPETVDVDLKPTFDERYAAWVEKLEVGARHFAIHLPFSALIVTICVFALSLGTVFFVDPVVAPSRQVRLYNEVGTAKAFANFANALASGLDVRTPTGFTRTICSQDVGLLRRIAFAEYMPCRQEEVRMERSHLADGDDLMTIGPVGPDFGSVLSRRLTMDPDATWSFAWGRTAVSRDLAWIDLRTVSRAELPLPPSDGSAWLFLRLHRGDSK